MKKTNLLLTASLILITAISFVFTSCKDDIIPLPDPGIEVDNKNVILDGKTFVQKLSIKSDDSWDVIKTQSASWLDYKIVEDGIIFIAKPNIDTKKRSTNIEIKSQSGEKTTTKIEQAPVTSDLDIISYSLTIWFNYQETFTEFYVLSTKNWTLTSDNPWITLDRTFGSPGLYKVTANFDANRTGDKRKAVITLNAGSKDKEQVFYQRAEKGLDEVTHCFYLNRGTFPVLYSGLLMLEHPQESWIIDQRGTLTKEDLPSNVTKLDWEDFPNNFINLIRQINNDDPDAVFGYYSDDFRIYYAIPIFTRLGIDLSRVKMKILPDGTATYSSLFSMQFGLIGEGESNYKGKQESLAKYIAKRIENPSISKVETLSDLDKDPDFQIPHVLSGYSNVEYYIQDRTYLKTEDPYVQQQVNTNNYIETPPFSMLQALTAAQQQKFYEMTDFDITKYTQLLDESPKPNLIIIGTHTVDNNPVYVSAAQQAQYVQEVMTKFSATHDVFYKAHPADKAYLTYETDFPGLKLITPAKMPFEVFTWALNDKIDAIGGFNSSVFITIPLDKVKFMFAADAAALGEPFYDLFKDRTDIYWIQ